MSVSVFSKLKLPNGSVLPNRLAKAAMEENMAAPGHLPGANLHRLYERWGRGGTGLLITGNVMIDSRSMTGPGDVVLEEKTPLEPFLQWTSVAQKNGAKLWAQINHPGRQTYAAFGGKVLSPSDVAVDLGKLSKYFSRPVPMTEVEIVDVIERFAITAKKAEQAGFSGIQIHAAHGYLLSQFLSPLTNKRQDKWGGSLENRARMLVEVVKAVRSKVSKKMSVSVKLNSADFQRGGFDTNDALEVVKRLGELKVDLVELSGGSYESPAMVGHTTDGRTLAREAYFLEFAKDVAKVASMPIMTTGGIRRLPVAQQVLDQGVDMVGIATALACEPELSNIWRNDPAFEVVTPHVAWKDKSLSGLATTSIVERQMHRMGKGKSPKKNASAILSLLINRINISKRTRQYKARYTA